MIDDIDKKVLNLLQEDGRTTYLEIAKRINKPVSTVHRRVEAMEKEGVIEGYSVIINPEKVGLKQGAFIIENAELGENSDFDKVGKKLAEFPEVTEVHFVTGEHDFIIKTRVTDSKAHYELMKKLSKNFSQGGKGSMFIQKTFKETHKLKL